MSKLTIYFPDALEAELRKGAKAAKKSLSAYLAGLVSKKRSSIWPKNFSKISGAWKGEFPEISDNLPETRKSFKD